MSFSGNLGSNRIFVLPMYLLNCLFPTDQYLRSVAVAMALHNVDMVSHFLLVPVYSKYKTYSVPTLYSLVKVFIVSTIDLFLMDISTYFPGEANIDQTSRVKGLWIVHTSSF